MTARGCDRLIPKHDYEPAGERRDGWQPYRCTVCGKVIELKVVPFEVKP